MLQSVLLIPVTMETFSSMYEILNEVLLNHYNTVFDIIPVFLSCSKHILCIIYDELFLLVYSIEKHTLLLVWYSYNN
jgi:hypothetical protein